MATKTHLREDLETTIKQAWWSLLALGVLAILFGVVALVWPGPTTLVAGIMFGVFLIVSGVVQIVAGLIGEAENRILSVISGALSLVLGAFCFRDDIANSVGILGVFIGIGWIFAGVWGVSAGIAGKHLPHRVWTIIVGVLTLAGGFVLIASPWSSMVVLMLVTGIWAIAIGVVEIIAAFQIRSKAKKVGQKVDDTIGRVEETVSGTIDGLTSRAKDIAQSGKSDGTDNA